MALNVESTKVITIDNNTRAVEECSDTVKRLVAFYDDWKERRAAVESELLMTQSAMQQLSNQIVVQIQKDDEGEGDEDGTDAEFAATPEVEAPVVAAESKSNGKKRSSKKTS